MLTIVFLVLFEKSIKICGSVYVNVFSHLNLSPDLSEPVHARAVVGGLVPQSPARPGSSVAARHRLPDGPPAQAAGVQQWLPALSGHHLW